MRFGCKLLRLLAWENCKHWSSCYLWKTWQRTYRFEHTSIISHSLLKWSWQFYFFLTSHSLLRSPHTLELGVVRQSHMLRIFANYKLMLKEVVSAKCTPKHPAEQFPSVQWIACNWPQNPSMSLSFETAVLSVHASGCSERCSKITPAFDDACCNYKKWTI